MMCHMLLTCGCMWEGDGCWKERDHALGKGECCSGKDKGGGNMEKVSMTLAT